MKILYYSGDDGTFMSKWQYDHFIDELQHHGVQVDFFNFRSYNCYGEANEKLIELLRNGHGYDCFMTSALNTQLYKETMKEISHIDIPKLLICFDNLHAPYIHKSLLPYFDLVWLTSKENENLFKSWGANTIFLPYAANPYTFYLPNYNEDINRVCFIGSPYGTRCLKFNKLVENNIPCDVYYGGNKKRAIASTQNKNKNTDIDFSLRDKLINYFSSPIGRKLFVSNLKAKVIKPQLVTNDYLSFYNSLSFSNMIKAYHSYALSLNITEVWSSLLLKHPIYKIHLRSFEIPMCGGIEFTSYNDEIAEYFEDGKEIVYYRDEYEYIDKARYYLDPKRQGVRNSMKIAARKRAETEHTWWNRFEQIFDRLGIKE